jgi:hypothetical protein
MVNEAEEFAEQDKKVKARIDARNQLETYCYNMKQSVGDKLKEKLEAGEVEAVEKAAQGALDWMDENQVRAGGWRGVGACWAGGALVWRGRSGVYVLLRALFVWVCGRESSGCCASAGLHALLVLASSAARANTYSLLSSHPHSSFPSFLPLAPFLPPFPFPCLQDAEKEDYEEKLKEVQDICGPIISKANAAAGGGAGGPGGDDEEDLGDHSEL